MIEIDTVDSLPSWWDWAVALPALLGLVYVLVTGVVAANRHKRTIHSDWGWFQRGLHPNVTGMSLLLGVFLFWFAPERHSVYYLLTIATLAIVSATVTIRLARLQYCNK